MKEMLNTEQKPHTQLSVTMPKYQQDSDLGSISSSPMLLPSVYQLSVETLSELHDPKSLHNLYDAGGIDIISQKLGTDLKLGLNDNDSEDLRVRAIHYSTNKLPVKLRKSFLKLCIEAMKDKVLVLLSIAAVVSLALGLYELFGQDTIYDDEGKPVPQVDWVEGVAILVAVAIVVIVGAANDYQKERQFARLNAKKEDRDVVVIRNGIQKVISIYDILVGDIMTIQTGDVLPADAILISGSVECDESAMTGESATLKKTPADAAIAFFEEYLPTEEDIGSSLVKFKDPYLISGAQIVAGLGHGMVTAVGPNSINGRTMLSLNEDGETTPLQARLDNLANGISKYGFLTAIVLFIVLFIRFCITIAPNGRDNDLPSAEKGKKFIDILITSVTIVVVAVPEGLPLAVTLALAFATTRMAQNGNLVRVLKSCETMGGATAVCTDKTGTLTENRMRVVRGFVDNVEFDCIALRNVVPKSEILSEISEETSEILLKNIVINSTAFENADYDDKTSKEATLKPEKISFLKQLMTDNTKLHNEMQMGKVNERYLGNKTECALLALADEKMNAFQDIPLEIQRMRASPQITQVIPFESNRKWSGVVMKINNGYRLYLKGAAEILFKFCGSQILQTGDAVLIDTESRGNILNQIEAYAGDALRTIALCHVDFMNIDTWPAAEYRDERKNAEADPDLLLNLKEDKVDKKLNLDAIVGIQDPLKDGIPNAILQCKQAGVTVRMVTGDNLTTAKAISKSCHIFTPEDLSSEYACMEGPTFRKLTYEQRSYVVPELKVLARSSPEDKRILVETLRNAGEVVAVTGDGTNDAPALKLADVGFSMGISGTEVAREASDIILMTDNFADIVQAIKWGRTVAISIKKFIQFQLTVNITACVLTFVSAVASTENHSVLTAVQLLWVNLIMDTLAALALATDKPDNSLLNRKPAGRKSPLISVSMWKMIIGQSITQLTVTFVLHFAGKSIFIGSRPATDHENKQLDSMTFNTFVWLQFWKLFVTRKLDEADGISKVRDRITAENLNFFLHLFRNWYFVCIALLIGSCQVLIMFVGGASFSIARQTPAMWGTAIVCGFLSLPAGVLLRICPNEWVLAIFPASAFKKFIYYTSFSFLRKSKKHDLENGE